MSTPDPILCDLDGVVWLARRPIPGSVEAVRRLRAGGHRVLFVTNNSAPRRSEHVAALDAVGIPDAEVLTSSMAAALLVEPGERVLVAGGDGIREAVEARGAVLVDGPDADAVIVGFHREFDYERLHAASRAVREGARLVGANEDATYPTPDGLIPGGGALLAAVATAAGAVPAVAGKPHQPMAQLVVQELGASASQGWMIGDRPSTDGRFARMLGCRFALVRTGVDAGDEAPEVVPDVVGDDLAHVADTLSTWQHPPTF